MKRPIPPSVGRPAWMLVAPVMSAILLATLIGTAVADQPLRLHVRGFTMRADHTQLRVGDTLHLTVELRTDETLRRCGMITLPEFFGFDALGEERRAEQRPTGTLCTVIITLSPTMPGEHTIAPATLEAIDAITNMPSRFAANTVVITVLHAPLSTATILRNTMIQMFKAFVVIVLLGALVGTAYWAFRRILPGFSAVRRIDEPPDSIGPAAQTESPNERERLSVLADALAARPTRQNVLAARMIVRGMVRAREDEVFGELLARTASTLDPALLDVMRTIERAAFIDDEHLADAVRDAVRALKQWTHKTRALTS